jgi:shikimate kinase
VDGVLVVVNGPIGSGKSTVASGLADELRQRHLSVAVIGLDDVLFMIRSLPNATLLELWDVARAAHSTLVDRFLWSMDVVIVDGPFFDREERAALLDGLSMSVEPLWVTLAVSDAEALHRVASDEARRLSRDPDFLRSAHEHFWTSHGSLAHPEPVYDTTTVSAQQIIALLTPPVLDRLGASRNVSRGMRQLLTRIG